MISYDFLLMLFPSGLALCGLVKPGKGPFGDYFESLFGFRKQPILSKNNGLLMPIISRFSICFNMF